MSVPTDDPLMSVMEQEYSMNSNVDPKNMQELTIYVSKMDWTAEHPPLFRTTVLIYCIAVLAGAEPIAECPGQVPDDVRPNNLPNRRHGQSNR